MENESENRGSVIGSEELSRGKGLIAKITAKANSAETAFLTILRYAGLAVAAVALVSAAILLGLGAFQQIGQTRVDPEQVSLAAQDIIPPQPVASEAARAATPQKVGVSQEVRRRTGSLYQRKFKNYQRADSKITDQEVVDYVWPEERITKFAALANPQLIGKDGKVLSDRDAAMLDALTLVDEAASTDSFSKQLKGYHDAQKVNVCNDEVKTRSHIVSGWDSTATTCPGWYDDPIGCATTRVVDEPYVEKVCTMKFPEELQSPAQQLALAVQRYADTAEAKLTSARNAAEEQTASNRMRKMEGIGHMSTAGTFFLVFLGVMFLYLFVALERHHRSLRRLIEKTQD